MIIDLLIVFVLIAAVLLATIGPTVARIAFTTIGLAILLVLLLLVGFLAFGLILQHRRELLNHSAPPA